MNRLDTCCKNPSLFMGDSESEIPVPSNLSADVISEFKAKGIDLCFQLNSYVKRGSCGFDSRTSECDRFLDVISQSQLGTSSVWLDVMEYIFPSPTADDYPDVDGDINEELIRWIRKLPLRYRETTSWDSAYGKLGCYASARDAIPAMVDALKRPDPHECPLSVQLGSKHCLTSLLIRFKNASFRVDVFLK